VRLENNNSFFCFKSALAYYNTGVVPNCKIGLAPELLPKKSFFTFFQLMKSIGVSFTPVHETISRATCFLPKNFDSSK
jgi:hypothetical protein